MKKYIYTLIDPISKEVKYVGCSNNPKHRLLNHVGLINYGHTKCKTWIKYLIDNDLEPILEIIEECGEDWVLREKYWINKFQQDGFTLVNDTIGGHCGKLSKEHILRKETQLTKALELISNGMPVVEAEKQAGLSNGYLYRVRQNKIDYLQHIDVPYFRKLKRNSIDRE